MRFLKRFVCETPVLQQEHLIGKIVEAAGCVRNMPSIFAKVRHSVELRCKPALAQPIQEGARPYTGRRGCLYYKRATSKLKFYPLSPGGPPRLDLSSIIDGDLQKFFRSLIMRDIAVGRAPVRNLPKNRSST
ncbi:hypothetical protein AVEN_15398-1 [Araneus ventricosus]|uniref:Uncharacterized protein n=1 Tax=Araneus ventricosus TaxID=182803 RepID=A0A4Y2CRV2_ARAVE|nr:hypothetical protein AVEN_15398-1 [Araneus ventricosus]